MSSLDSHLDRAAERRTDLDFLEAQLSNPDTRLLPVWRGQPFVAANELRLLRLAEAPEFIEQSREIIWLGLWNGQGCFALDLSALPEPLTHASLSGSEPSELRALLGRLPAGTTELALYARAMLSWHERHQFCASCGHATRPRNGGHLRVCARAQCAAQHFPRTDPCVLVLVHDGERCLLGRSRGWPSGMYSALAGFVEPGETLEQAAAREVLEESGVAIGDVRYFGSQPWPFPASLMVGFVANAVGGDLKVDGIELETARWVSRAELNAGASPEFFVPKPEISLSGQLIAAFAAGRV
jgi:NAD+ diphosphatase